MGARDVAVGEAQNIFQADLNINIDVVVMMPISPCAQATVYTPLYIYSDVRETVRRRSASQSGAKAATTSENKFKRVKALRYTLALPIMP